MFDRTNLADLRLFLTIVRRQSFTSAAIELGITPSAASHAIRRLERKLGIKLLNRTSRAIRPTDIGQDLANNLTTGFDAIDEALQSVQAPGVARFGELRINAFADAAQLVLAPALPEFVRSFPETRLSLSVEERPIDIVAEGYDAGIRYGHHVPEDMVAVALTGPQRWIVVAAPSYVEAHGAPQKPVRAGTAHLPSIAAGRRFQLSVGAARRGWRTGLARAGKHNHQGYRNNDFRSKVRIGVGLYP